MSSFLTFITVLYIVSHVHALNVTHCNLSPSPAPSVLLTNDEYANFIRRMDTMRGTSERYSISSLPPVGEVWDMGSENGKENLVARQVRTLSIMPLQLRMECTYIVRDVSSLGSARIQAGYHCAQVQGHAAPHRTLFVS